MEIVIKLNRLKLPNASNSAAKDIFEEIKNKTGAVVLWERGTKKKKELRGSKNKSDDPGSKTNDEPTEPSVKICGEIDSIKKARDMLLEELEIKSNRVEMKMEVTHQEHPTLIGKGGKLNKRVMAVTECQIHFPDVNKNLVDDNMKQNQVSIQGNPANVERARVLIRALIPIQIYFEAPKTSFDSCFLETKFWGSYNGLHLYTAPGQNSSIVIVIIRCNQDIFSQRRKDVTMLMEQMCCTNAANLPPVHMVMDVMQQHQDYVKGPKNCNIQGIVKRTGAQITFPNNISEKRSIKISGSLDSVYVAWLEIMNFLPVTVSFDVNATRKIEGEYKNFLQDLGIVPSVSSPNYKYHTKKVTLTGPEKFSKQMLQYRQHLLRLKSLCFKPEMEDLSLVSNLLADLNEYIYSPIITSVPRYVTNIRSKSITASQLTQALNTTASQKSLLFRTNNLMIPVICGESYIKEQFAETEYYMASSKDIKLQSSHLLLSLEQNKISSAEQTIQNENGYWKPKIGENSNTQGQLLKNNNWIKNIPFENSISANFSELTRDQSVDEQSHKVSGLPQPLFMENQNGETTLAEDYYRKKVLAARAMRRPIDESAQVPTSLWAGYGFSHSMPAAVLKESLDALNQYNCNNIASYRNNSGLEDRESCENMVAKDGKDVDIWSNEKETTFSHSNYFDFSRSMHFPIDNAAKNILSELLAEQGLHEHINTFAKQEIDLQSFLELRDIDLKKMDIPPPAREKLVYLIRVLRKHLESMESTRVPTSQWAGYDFSQSMPTVVMKDCLDSVNLYNHFNFGSCSSNSSSEDLDSCKHMTMTDYRDIWFNKKMKETTMKYKTFHAAPGAERKSFISRLDNQQIF